MDNLCVWAENVSMAQRVTPRFKKPLAPQRHFIKEWRKYRRLTQEQLAERAGMTPNNLSQLENHKQRYSAEGLERLAEALQAEPAQLLMVDPSKDDAIWSIWERAKPAERQQIIAVARALVAKTGT
jgi:transcriptional regulator with XRE-family HTH domain